MEALPYKKIVEGYTTAIVFFENEVALVEKVASLYVDHLALEIL